MMTSKRHELIEAPGRPIRIEPLKLADYEEMVRLWRSAGLHYRPRGRDSRRDMARQLRLPAAVYLKAVTRADGKSRIVGVVLGTHDGRRGWINRLAVLPEFQRLGLGRRLVAQLDKRFRALGLDIVAVQVDKGNRASMGFFAALGYVRHSDIHYYSKRKGPWV